MGYTELVQFAADCRLTSLPRLSRLEVGKIYLASAPCPANSPGKRYTHLRFSHFWEALVRFAMLAFSEMRSRQDIGEQVCGLFLVMWRTLSEAQGRGAKGPPARTDYLQQIYKSFLERFFAFWAHDNHREYLVEQQGPAARAPDVLSRLMGEQVAAPSADTRQTVGDRLRAHAQNARDTRAEYAYE